MLKKTIGTLLLMGLCSSALADTYVTNNYYTPYPYQSQPTYYYHNNTGAIVATAAIAGTTGYLIGRSTHHNNYYYPYHRNYHYNANCYRTGHGSVHCHGYR